MFELLAFCSASSTTTVLGAWGHLIAQLQGLYTHFYTERTPETVGQARDPSILACPAHSLCLQKGGAQARVSSWEGGAVLSRAVWRAGWTGP